MYEVQNMAWFILIMAGLLEIVWALGLKYSEGFTKPLITTVTIIVMGASFYLLAIAMKSLPMGTAYAVWTGIGAVGIFICGVILFNEPFTLLRVGSAALIVMGIVGLKISALA